MNIAIVEDNVLLTQTIKAYLDRLPIKTNLVFHATNITDAITGFSNNKIDLALLDVEIKGGLVFDALNQLPEVNFDVLFLSAYGKYAIDAFQFSALNYLLKPVDYEKFEVELLKAERKRSTEDKRIDALAEQFLELERMVKTSAFDKIALPALDGISFYHLKDIIRVEAAANYCVFYIVNGERVTVSKPLKEYVDLLEKGSFYRIHKSHIVNLNFVKKYIKGEGGIIILEDGNELPVSRRRKEGLLEVLKIL